MVELGGIGFIVNSNVVVGVGGGDRGGGGLGGGGGGIMLRSTNGNVQINIARVGILCSHIFLIVMAHSLILIFSSSSSGNNSAAANMLASLYGPLTTHDCN